MDIGNAMKRLPRTNASPRFTSEVLRRAASQDDLRGRHPFRFAAAFALMLCVAVLSYEAAVIHQRHQRLDALRAEHQRIETELQQVKAIADDPRPVVVLENDDTRVIVPIANRQSARTAHQPIIY
jgi:hypothetical protein